MIFQVPYVSSIGAQYPDTALLGEGFGERTVSFQKVRESIAQTLICISQFDRPAEGTGGFVCEKWAL